MAVSIKSLNGLGAIGKLGIDQKLVDWLAEGHYEIKLTSKEFAFFPAGSGDLPPVATVPVSLDLLQKLNGGTLPHKRQVGIGEDDDEHAREIAINCKWRDAGRSCRRAL